MKLAAKEVSFRGGSVGLKILRFLDEEAEGEGLDGGS